MTAHALRTTVTLKPLVQDMRRATASRATDDRTLWLDFGRAAFGTVVIPVNSARSLRVHLGEKLDDAGRIDRNPPGTIRYRRIEQQAQPGDCRIIIPPDERNTRPGAILMPPEVGEVLPFRYVEIENAADIPPHAVQQVAVHYPFDDDAASFRCSSEVLNAVWDLCKYSIKATTFCGVYVDGDRERIPYEGDAYINQLGHYGVDHEYDFARYSHEYMIQRPTWCTEWHLHSVLMAWADYLYTANTTSIAEFYDELVAKTLIDFAREDGLISVDPELRTEAIHARIEPHFETGIIKRNIRDVVDWPPGSFTTGGTGERDDHEMRPINTVVNAFHYHALRLMAKMAGAVDRHEDQQRFDQRADAVYAAFNRMLCDPATGLYIDGEGSTHASLHSNMFALAFELVPDQRKQAVVDFVKSRGMACSVYGAQHLLDALYMTGQDHHAMKLLTATHDRSWHNMIAAGSTITLEAWDWKYKNNLDWNHAWGAAPANIIPRWVLGVRPASPGFTRAIVDPMLGDLDWAEGTVPTPHGPIHVRAEKTPDGQTNTHADLPEGIQRVCLGSTA